MRPRRRQRWAEACATAVGLTLAFGCTQRPVASPPGRARPPAHAGTWYPAESAALGAAIDSRLESAPPSAITDPIIAMVAPHAGLRFSGTVAAAGYAVLGGQTIRRVFLLGPSHHLAFSGVALPAPDLGTYATPLGDLTIDRSAVEALRGAPGFEGPARAHLPEHSLEMNAIFLARVLPRATLVPLVIGRLEETTRVADIATRLRSLIGAGDLVVVSSDFTHFGPNYGYTPFATDVPDRLRMLLSGALLPLSQGRLEDFDAHLGATDDTICGREPLRLLTRLLPTGSHGTEVAHDTSGRITGDFTNSVTYAAMAFSRRGGWPPAPPEAFRQGPQVLGPEAQKTALRIARRTLESYLKTRSVPDRTALAVPADPVFAKPYGTFVTLNTKGGQLRGCIGSILPRRPLWQDIRDNAIAAAVRDRRFAPVTSDELSQLSLEVSVLTHPAQVPGPESIEIGRHGIIIETSRHRAVFLPQVAPEQGWDRPTTLSQLSRKAGLEPDGWRRPEASFRVFEAQVFGELGEHPTAN